MITRQWLAGFVDGEGCISLGKFLRRKNPNFYSYHLAVSFSQKHVSILQEIRNFLGFGHIYTGETYSTFQCAGRQSERLLLLLLPHLRVKLLQAKVALHFMKFKEYEPGFPLSMKEQRWREMHNQLLKLCKEQGL